MGFQFGTKKEEPKVEETKEEEKPVEGSKEDWMTKKWRPMMAMMYMLCCLADFAIFPIMFTIVQFWETQAANDAFRQWVPITLQGGGLFHVAMGAVLGVSAFGRTQEKIAGAAGAGVPTPTLSSEPPKFTPSMSVPNNQYSPQPSMMQSSYSPSQSYSSSYQDTNMNLGGNTISRVDPNSEGFRPTVRRPI